MVGVHTCTIQVHRTDHMTWRPAKPPHPYYGHTCTHVPKCQNLILIITKLLWIVAMSGNTVSDANTAISSLTCGSEPISTASIAQSTRSGGVNTTNNTKKKPWARRPVAASVTTFKGAIPELSNKVLITGHQQASKYEEAYKALLLYINHHFNHRVHLAMERKDASAGLALLSKPVAPKKTVVVEIEDPNDPKNTITTTKIEIDKDSEDFFEY